MLGAVGLIIGLVGGPCAAAPPLTDAPTGGRFWVDVGWDPTWVIEVGAGRRVGDVRAAGPVELQAVITAPIVLLSSLGGAELALGAATRTGPEGPLGVEVGGQMWAAGARDPLGAKVGLGVDLVARPGWAWQRGAAGLELGWRQGLATRARHSEAVQDLFGDRYPDAEPAPEVVWLRSPVRRQRLGVFGAWQPTEPLTLALSGGLERTAQEQGIAAQPSLGQLPFTAHLSGSTSW